jgi:hypothetical protein
LRVQIPASARANATLCDALRRSATVCDGCDVAHARNTVDYSRVKAAKMLSTIHRRLSAGAGMMRKETLSGARSSSKGMENRHRGKHRGLLRRAISRFHRQSPVLRRFPSVCNRPRRVLAGLPLFGCLVLTMWSVVCFKVAHAKIVIKQTRND